MKVYGIASLTLYHQLFQGENDGVACGMAVLTVIHEDENVVFLIAMHIHNILFDVKDIVVTTTQLSILAAVIDAHEDCTASSLSSH